MKMCINCLLMIDEQESRCPHCGYADSEHPIDFCHLPPRTLLSGRYIVGRPLGCGGFGVTYIAWDIKMSRRVAIKEYMPGELASRTAGSRIIEIRPGCEDIYRNGKQSFVNESMRLARMGGISGVVPIYDCFEDEYTAYIVMEYLEGETLQQRLDREGKLGWKDCCDIFVKVLGTLESIHARGIMHRDIAPDNIMLCPGGRVVLIDFGAARHMTTRFSRSLSTILKIGYAPPEQYDRHGNQGPWTDIYAIGATMYHALTGTVPPDAFTRVSNDTLVDPAQLAKIPSHVRISILNAMNLTPARRPQSAAHLADMLTGKVRAVRVHDRIKKDNIQISPATKTLLAVSSAAAVIVLLLILFGVPALILPDSMAKVPEHMSRVPAVQDMTLEQARSAMEENDLRLQISRLVYDDFFDNGVVLYQESAAGSVVYRGSVVNVVLSAPGPKNVVPDVSGYILGNAQKQLWQRGFETTVIEQHSDLHAPGSVISQSTPSGRIADQDTVIELTVSLGPENGPADGGRRVSVPAISGMTFDEARRLMLENGLYLCRSGTVFNDGILLDEVVTQSPTAGERMPQGSIIYVVTNMGAETIVPDLSYMTEDEAIAELSSRGLVCSSETSTSEDVASGLVFRQDALAGSRVQERSHVTLYISSGSTVTMPDCIGRELGEAAALLLESRLAYSVVRRSSADVPEGFVMAQSEYQGANLSAGSIVMLTVSSGTENVPLRKVTLSETRLELTDGDRHTLTFTARPADASCTAVSWNSSDVNVAAVNRFGVITAISEGTAVITVTSEDGNHTDTCRVTVSPAPEIAEYRYEVVDGEAHITWYIGAGEDELVIPEEIDGYRVTAIADYAFAGHSSLTNVTIPEGVTSIGNKAFDMCSSLRKIHLPDSLTYIGNSAFESCSNLSSVAIPEGVRVLNPGVFCYCSTLTEVTLHDKLEFIDYDAFMECDSLESITIPRSVGYVNGGAFDRCDKLTDITVEPDGRYYVSVDGVVFYRDKSAIVVFPSGRTGEYTIPDGVQLIEGRAFAGSKLSSLTLPDSLRTIGSYCFSEMKIIEHITIPDGVKTIEAGTFSDCTSLQSVTLPDGLTTIGDQAFYRCQSLRELNVPDSVKSIGTYAFEECYNLD